MADVEQTQKMIPFITCEISLCQYVCECGFWKHVSLQGFFPLWSSWSPASLSAKIYNNASWQEECTFEDIKTTLSNGARVSPFLITLIRVSVKNATIRSHKSSAGIPSNLNPASKEMISDSVELCETDLCFLHIQLIGTNVWLPKMHNVPPEVDFESPKISRKIGVLKQSQSALFCSITHIAVLFVFTCVMNVRDQTRQSFVTCFGPFSDRSCKLIHWPQNIWSSNSCQI